MFFGSNHIASYRHFLSAILFTSAITIAPLQTASIALNIHQDGTPSTVKNNASTKLPPKVAKKFLSVVAQQLSIPPQKLKILATQQRTFNGCLGIYQPNQVCTMIAISGWQIIVGDGRKTWVYHTDRDANRIVQNTTASNSEAPIAVSFRGDRDSSPEAEVIFRSRVAGGFAGPNAPTTIFTLTTDGKITKLITSPTIKATPVTIRTLTPQQVTAFQQFLQQRQFPNLNGLKYESTIVADFPTTTLESPEAIVDYVDPDLKKLPPSLRATINRWNRLIK